MNGTIFPNEFFDCEVACQSLKDAMDGCGTNEKDIIAVLTTNSNEQRQQIKEQYKQLFGEDLIDSLKSELGGDFEEVCLALLDPPRTYDAHELHRAISGLGTCENTLIEIMVTRTNEEIDIIKGIYAMEYENELEQDLVQDTSGYFRRIMVSLVNAHRDEDWGVNDDLAMEDAQKIYEAGEGQLGTDESEFNSVLCQRTLPQIQATLAAYQLIADKELKDAIESETSGSVKEGYLAIISAAVDLRKYFATRLHEAMSGLGTNDSDLIRLIVSRCEIDLASISCIFQEMYQENLAEKIDGECGGNYKKILIAILS